MPNDANSNRIIFFLGAGASIPSGVSGMVRLVDEFVAQSKQEDFEVINLIKTVLTDWTHENNPERAVDVELMMEAIDKLENSNKEILLKFCKNPGIDIRGFKHDNHLSKDIRQFIRMKCFVLQSKVVYLRPFLGFLDGYNELDIFSTNYDNCIEQFSDKFNTQCEDRVVPFQQADSPSQVKTHSTINLYKLHGSITWWRNEQGDVFNIPIRINSENIPTSSGTSAVPIILYPGNKQQYSEPFLGAFMEFKKRLQEADYVIAIGYSFNDEHITKLFQYGARKNRKLVVIIIDPCAWNIYDKKLRYLKDTEFPKGFTRSLNWESFTAPVPSNLQSRVIVLPYKIEKIFSILKSKFIRSLTEAEKLQNELGVDGVRNDEEKWKTCIRNYLDCDFVARVDEMIEEIDWNEFVQKDWRFCLETSLNSLISRSIAGNKENIEEWKIRFKLVSDLFSINKLEFSPSIVPATIKLGFKNRGPGFLNELSEFVRTVMLPVIAARIVLAEDDKNVEVKMWRKKVELFLEYLVSWSREVGFDKYCIMRSSNYSPQISELKRRFDFFKQSNGNEGKEQVIEKIMQIEGNELNQILGGNELAW